SRHREDRPRAREDARPVVLRWHLQLGLVAIPRTSNPSRLPENLDVFDLELTPEDMERIATLDRDGSGALDPESFGH
ncbi:MAG TPA: aldo/keto reductase, partial [Actinomycetota bacterium]|nr:aldo/keto reductase [Actinomycetota bacterium]